MNLKNPISVATVSGYVSDEVHLTRKASLTPVAKLHFIPVGADGKRVDAPVAIATFTGKAFNELYSAWTGERSLYVTALELLLAGREDVVLDGADLSKLASPSELSVPDAVPEVLNSEI